MWIMGYLTYQLVQDFWTINSRENSLILAGDQMPRLDLCQVLCDSPSRLATRRRDFLFLEENEDEGFSRDLSRSLW